MLFLGTDKTPILDHLPTHFLLIDDGPLIDALTIPKRRKVTRLDFTRHSFNPLKDMDDHRARELIQIFDAIFPEGANTLTKKNSNHFLLKTLVEKRTPTVNYLDRLLSPSKNPYEQDAYQKIENVLLSPLLRRVLCNPTNFTFSGILLARLDRAAMGDFDCFLLANLLISQYPGTVVIPDFGFYGRDHHIQLIRQNRLIAGLYTLSEVGDHLRQGLLLGTMEGHGCTYDDACTLADYAGIPRHINRYNDFVDEAMKRVASGG